MKRTAGVSRVVLAELEAVARSVRGDIVEMSYRTGAPHVGSSLSCVDILVAAYWSALQLDPHQPEAPERDRFILSKGHAAATLYSVLSRRGFFSSQVLASYTKGGSPLPEHPIARCVPGVEVTSGSLGHGLSLAIGMALAGRIQHHNYRTVVVMSDGECNEGSVWEAALLAPALGLDKLVVLIDYNKWQATGRSNEVTSLNPLIDKWRAFGWSAYEIDGHNLASLVERLRATPDGSRKPVAIVAHTVKGKGISFMEDDNNWHYRIPTADELKSARKELGLA